MKPATLLNNIMKMEDSNLKLMKLFGFCLTKSLSTSSLWNIANSEFNRLWDLGYRIGK
jgi:hypothetical protein